MSGPDSRPHLLADAPPSELAAAQAANDRASRGDVMNLTKLWAYQPASKQALFDLLDRVATDGGLSDLHRRVIVPAVASTLGDSYCSVAWGSMLAESTSAEASAGVLRGDDSGLGPAEQVLAGWIRKVVEHPSGTRAEDVEALRTAGFDDAQIFAVTAFAALRLAFSTINGALGAHPDAFFESSAPAAVLAAIDYGRPIGG